MSEQCGWDTEDELRYIDAIGLNSPNTVAQTQREMLERYWVAVTKRKVWGGIDRKQVLAYLCALLAR